MAPTCSVCGTDNSVKMRPLMTGVPFSAPEEEQVFVCSDCFEAWYDGGGTTREAILKRKNELGHYPLCIRSGVE